MGENVPDDRGSMGVGWRGGGAKTVLLSARTEPRRCNSGGGCWGSGVLGYGQRWDRVGEREEVEMESKSKSRRAVSRRLQEPRLRATELVGCGAGRWWTLTLTRWWAGLGCCCWRQKKVVVRELGGRGRVDVHGALAGEVGLGPVARDQG